MHGSTTKTKKRVTINEIAQLAGTSKTTVSFPVMASPLWIGL